MTKSETIKIQVGEEVIELTGAEKAAFLADREKTNQTIKAEADAKTAAKQIILDRIGLTVDELKTILG